ncbi:MAG: helix-turn-helix domain-containing protein [Nitrospirota bacterium]|nr:helix-turn-helix domain-containing protein [Nitrospirota bacterium]
MSKEMLTTKEVAEYLNINEKQVYKLIADKKIPCTRATGKWTFPRKLVDEWIVSDALTSRESGEPDTHLVMMGSNDMTTELLEHELERQFPQFTVSWGNVGSVGGLVALDKGICHVAGCHLFDPATGTYNLPFLARYIPNVPAVMVNLVYRQQGLMVLPGNPMAITGLSDLVKPGMTFINRQETSGTRQLLDFRLKEEGIEPGQIAGYDREVFTHMEVAIAVLGGTAHTGLGIRSAARALGLDFIPIARERYDLVIPQKYLYTSPVKALLEVIRSEHFRDMVNGLGGYDTKDSGSLMV